MPLQIISCSFEQNTCQDNEPVESFQVQELNHFYRIGMNKMLIIQLIITLFQTINYRTNVQKAEPWSLIYTAQVVLLLLRTSVAVS